MHATTQRKPPLTLSAFSRARVRKSSVNLATGGTSRKARSASMELCTLNTCGWRCRASPGGLTGLHTRSDLQTPPTHPVQTPQTTTTTHLGPPFHRRVRLRAHVHVHVPLLPIERRRQGGLRLHAVEEAREPPQVIVLGRPRLGPAVRAVLQRCRGVRGCTWWVIVRWTATGRSLRSHVVGHCNCTMDSTLDSPPSIPPPLS